MDAAVDDGDGPIAALLGANDANHEQPGRAAEPPSRFEQQSSTRERRAIRPALELAFDRPSESFDVELTLAVGVWDAKPASAVDKRDPEAVANRERFSRGCEAHDTRRER